ncbi:hypothetical protein LU276_08320 [Moraxella haemolytica]|uniref:hypothetical protein n=1 Tax=Moraxella haemolytica TaxID=2904119 RepID=UPI0025432110|nr:hypothetical protein [Moraxella sp. ZY171148]WII95005.1 hypothetical protein LU276_08320 [Moraxella sp. ZY171148]
MKKIFKIIAIIIGILFVIGVIGAILETPEQKAEREAKAATEKAEKEAQHAIKQAEADAKAKAETEKAAKEQAEKEAELVADFGMTPQELGRGIDQRIKDVMNVETTLANVKSGSISFDMDLGEGIIWSGNVNEQGKASATSLQMKIREGDEQGRVMSLLLLVGATVQVLHPDLPNEQASQKVGEMTEKAINKALKTQEAVTESIMIGDIKHFIEVYPSSGVIKIGAAHKDQ